MLLSEMFLSETREDYIIKTLGPKIIDSIKRDNSFIQDLLSQIPANDNEQSEELYSMIDNRSTEETNLKYAKIVINLIQNSIPNQKYTMWVSLQYANKRIRIEDLSRVSDALYSFEGFKNQLPANERDINKYTLPQLENKISQLYGQETTISKRKQKQQIKLEGADKIYDGNDCTILHLKTKEAACYYGQGTKWCTAATYQNAFDSYNKHGPLYILIPKQQEMLEEWGKIQISFEANQIMHDDDTEVRDIERFRINFPGYEKLLNRKSNDFINRIKNIPDKEYAIQVAIRFAKNFIKDRWPELESILLKTESKHIGDYCIENNIRWPEAEPAIIKNSDTHTVFRYCKYSVKKKWPEAEHRILENMHNSMEYYRFFFVNYAVRQEHLRWGRWDKLENSLLDSFYTIPTKEDLENKKRNGMNSLHEVAKDLEDYANKGYANKRWPALEQKFLYNVPIGLQHMIHNSTKQDKTEFYSITPVSLKEHNLLMFGTDGFTSQNRDDCYFNKIRFENHPWNEYEKVLLQLGDSASKASRVLMSLDKRTTWPGLDMDFKKLGIICAFEYAYYPYATALDRNSIKLLNPKLKEILNTVKSARRHHTGSKEFVAREFEMMTKYLLFKQDPVFSVK